MADLEPKPDGPGTLPESTATLLARARAGDERAKNQLLKRYRVPLARWAHGRLPANARDQGDTDDLVQVTLLRALNKLETFEPRHEGAFLAYLRTILQNEVYNQIRSMKRRPTRCELDDASPDPGPSPLDRAIGADVRARYEKALLELSEDQRAAVVLRLELGKSYEEIAGDLERPSGNAARLLVTRALLRLARVMRACRE